MKPATLSTIRFATCAIGWIKTTWAEFYKDPKRSHLEIEGTGFLVGPKAVITCAHVVDSLQQIKRKQGNRAFEWGLQFVYPSAGPDADMTTAFRSFTVPKVDARIDMAHLKLEGSPVPVSPVAVVSQAYAPAVGEAVGLCGYAHGSVLLTRGKETYRFGPVVQTGIIAALSPFDLAQPEAVLLDLVTGPAASGSPVFRQTTGEVFGFLVEGQIKKHAALSVARLTYSDGPGRLAARIARFEPVRLA